MSRRYLLDTNVVSHIMQGRDADLLARLTQLPVGRVVLSPKPTDWQGLLDVVAQNSGQDLLIERRQTHTRRDPFEGLAE